MGKYDIFISYRRFDAGDKAEHLKDLLEPLYKGRVSFDRENLTGVFDSALVERIDKCKDFLLVVNKTSLVFNDADFNDDVVAVYKELAQCPLDKFEEKIKELGDDFYVDFVRLEISRAVHRKDLNIIPIVPETTGDYSFGKLKLPSDIIDIKRYEAVFYSENPDALFKDIIPKVNYRMTSSPDTLLKKICLWILPLIVLVSICVGIWALFKHKERLRRDELMLVTALNGEMYMNWFGDISISELEAINEILANMVKVEGGTFMMGAGTDADNNYAQDVDLLLETPQIRQSVETFWICKYEVSVGEWARIMGESYDKANALMPVVNVSFKDCIQFVTRLSDLSGLNFDLPTEAEWEYAARGGKYASDTKYAGGDIPDKVAWYCGNSGGKVHTRNDVNGGLYCNALDLFDMSGNVSEWCNTDFRLYSDIHSSTKDPFVIDNNSKVIRGGNFDSESYGISVTYREPMNINEKNSAVGLRIIVRVANVL